MESGPQQPSPPSHASILRRISTVSLEQQSLTVYEPFDCTLRGYLNGLSHRMTLHDSQSLGIALLSALECLASSGYGIPTITPDTIAVCTSFSVYPVFKLIADGPACTHHCYTAPELSEATGSSTSSATVAAALFAIGVVLIESIACSVVASPTITRYTSPFQFGALSAAACAYLKSVSLSVFGNLLEDCTAFDASARPRVTAALTRLTHIALPAEVCHCSELVHSYYVLCEGLPLTGCFPACRCDWMCQLVLPLRRCPPHPLSVLSLPPQHQGRLSPHHQPSRHRLDKAHHHRR